MNLFDMFNNQFEDNKKETVAPVNTVAAPVIEVTAPVIETVAPVIETVDPVIEVVAPVIEVAAPVIETVDPVIEVAAPVNTVTAPYSESNTSEDNYDELFKSLGKAEEVEEIEATVTSTLTPKEPAKKKEETFKVDPNTQIRYFGTVTAITEYFSLDEITTGLLVKGDFKQITQEDVRKRLEKVFPELTKKDSHINLIESKNIIVPSMMAKKKGVEPISDIGSLFLNKKIPYSIIFTFINISKIFSKVNKEVHADIYFDFDKNEYFIDLPKQIISTLNVEVIENPLITLERIGYNSTKVLEIHSHHTMNPTPSAQDNASERVIGMYYAIVGNLEFGWPTITIRKYIKENHWEPVNIDSIYESPFIETPIDFKSNFTNTFILGEN